MLLSSGTKEISPGTFAGVRKKPLPDFTLLWGNYPRGSSAMAKALIGGNVNLPWLDDTCVVRVSHALNLAGHRIPRSYPIPRGVMETVPGKNGMRYAFRCEEFHQYLSDKYGTPDLTMDLRKPGACYYAMYDHPSIVHFQVASWGVNATGHFDIINTASGNIGFGTSEYVAKASHIHVWWC